MLEEQEGNRETVDSVRVKPCPVLTSPGFQATTTLYRVLHTPFTASPPGGLFLLWGLPLFASYLVPARNFSLSRQSLLVVQTCEDHYPSSRTTAVET